jgi:hypothetical protein
MKQVESAESVTVTRQRSGYLRMGNRMTPGALAGLLRSLKLITSSEEVILHRHSRKASFKPRHYKTLHSTL